MCGTRIKLWGLVCWGHVSFKLEVMTLECLDISTMEYFSKFRLEAPSPKAIVTRTTLHNLSMQNGFNDNGFNGDITVHFRYLKEGEQLHHVVTNLEKKKTSIW